MENQATAWNYSFDLLMGCVDSMMLNKLEG